MKTNRKNIHGATMTEYVLLIGLVAAGAIIALTGVGSSISNFFSSLSSTITGSGSSL